MGISNFDPYIQTISPKITNFYYLVASVYNLVTIIFLNNHFQESPFKFSRIFKDFTIQQSRYFLTLVVFFSREKRTHL